MKLLSLLLVTLILLGFACELPLKGLPKTSFFVSELGKTHFILGLDPTVPFRTASLQTARKKTGAHDSLTKLLVCDDGTINQAFFSPDDDVKEILLQLIDREKASIKIAIYSLTDKDIAQALVEAHQRGVAVEIVTDISCTRDRFNKIDYLIQEQIAVLVYNPNNKTILNNIMHNKFVIFGMNVNGKSLLWTGSFNMTKSAGCNNQENVIISDNLFLIEKYVNQFYRLQRRIKEKEPIKLSRRKKRAIELQVHA